MERTSAGRLDLTYNDSQWVISSNVSITQGDVLFTFPDRSSSEISKICDEIRSAAKELIETVERLPRLGQKRL
jgi:hypothetical protein